MPQQILPKFINPAMATDAEVTAAVSLKADIASPTFTGTVALPTTSISGKISQSSTITAPATTGNRTINTPTGTVNFAVGAEVIVVTNSLATANSLVFGTVRTDGTNGAIWTIVPAAGSFTITLAGPVEVETSVGFWVIN